MDHCENLGAVKIHPPNYYQMLSYNIEALREVATLDWVTSWRVRCLMNEPSGNECTHGFLRQISINYRMRLKLVDSTLLCGHFLTFSTKISTRNLTFNQPKSGYRTKSWVLNERMIFWNTQNIFKKLHTVLPLS